MKQIRLILSRPAEKTGQCASRFWGNPDLPPGYGYPEYVDEDGDICEYRFICQINLAEIAGFDLDRLLPHKGLLSFFARIDRYLGDFEALNGISGYISDPEDVKVLYFPEAGLPGEDSGFRELVLVDEDDVQVNPEELRIDFAADKPEDCYDDHALLAPPYYREWETWDPPFEDWEILLQVDSFSGEDFNLNFMDCGVLDFLISPEDLAASRFDRVRAIVLST